jgi:hypothetical protein
MRLFISYARVDNPYCAQIVNTLDVHEVWFDRRLHAGQAWWEEICRRIEWCEGFIYLLSPDSVESRYCMKEFEMAHKAGKSIFPVLIHPKVAQPAALKALQAADLTKGLTPDAVKTLLNAIYVAERQKVAVANGNGKLPGSGTTATPVYEPMPTPPGANPNTLMDEVAEAMEAAKYDRAVFLLKDAKEQGYKSRFVNLESVLREAEAALERQTYVREAEREYKPIASLVRRKNTRKLGCKAFQEFRKQFPDFDPDNIASVCATVIIPLLEWCMVPAGEVTIDYDQKSVVYYAESFQMSKYPITNAQFQAFVDAEDGYCNRKWWDFSLQARTWREQHDKPLAPKFSWGEHPRAIVCWYVAMAFCNWLSEKTGLEITLPTEQQWQRAAQGDDNRVYPWGSKFDKEKCNSRDSQLRTTCAVTKHGSGVSPFGVYGMAGNVWQWCSNKEYGKHLTDKNAVDMHSPRAVRGGSFISTPQRVRSTFHFYLNPLYRYATIGFRVIAKL